MGTQCTCRCLHILLVEYLSDVCRHQSVSGHLIGIQPDTQRIIRSHHIDLTDTRYTRQTGFNIDFQIIDEEFLVITVIRTVKSQ